MLSFSIFFFSRLLVTEIGWWEQFECCWRGPYGQGNIISASKKIIDLCQIFSTQYYISLLYNGYISNNIYEYNFCWWISFVYRVWANRRAPAGSQALVIICRYLGVVTYDQYTALHRNAKKISRPTWFFERHSHAKLQICNDHLIAISE